jgi:RND family efflux transporter MFP subunit
MRAILIVLGLFAVLPAAAQTGAPAQVSVARPVVKEIVEDDEFVGRFAAPEEIVVRARVGGYLQTIHFTDGAYVAAGQLLFTIDQRTFRAAVEESEAQLRTAEASIAFAREQLERAERLIANGNIAQSVVDERRQEFLRAQAALDGAKAALTGARISLDFTEIRAGIAGRIGRAQVTEGNLVQADQTELTSIVSTDPMHFYFDIDERFYLAYARDARARGGEMQQGSGGLAVRVTLADPAIAPRAGALDFAENRLDAETGTMRMRAVFANPDGVLTPGLFGRINIPGSLPYRGVLIPDEAIVADQNRRLVNVVDADGKVTPREIRPGPRIDGYRVVREGLDGSETIVVNGLMRLRPGVRIAPQMTELPPVRG